MRWKKDRVMIIAGLLACLLATVLLVDIRQMFYTDWNNQLWLIEYFGESLKHWKILDVINTPQIIGKSDPLFYAGKFYTLSGLLSVFLGSAITIRILAFGVLFLQFFQVYRAAKESGSDEKVSIGIAVMVTWAIYPLTNLYDRSAITEFFSIAFLTCSAASFLCVVLKSKEQVSGYDAIATGLFFVAAAETHPLTALFGGSFLFILGLIALIFGAKEKRQWLLAFYSVTAFVSMLILSPWIYILCLYKDKLLFSSPTSNTGNFRGGWFFPGSIDNIWSRLSPVPVDIRSIEKGVHLSGPYLEAQIAVPLVLLMGAFFYIGLREKTKGFDLNRCEQALIWGAVVLLIAAFTVSVCPQVSGWFGGFFDVLQFPYRLTNYVNLPILMMLIILAGRMRQAYINSRQIMNVCLAFCLAISFSALMIKLVDAAAIMNKSTESKVWLNDTVTVLDGAWMPLPIRSTSHLIDLPPTFYGWPYSVEDGFLKESSLDTVALIRRSFNVLDKDRFGHVEPLTVNVNRQTLVMTNVEPFPWNQIVIDGIPLPQSGTFVAEDREAVLLSAGRHLLVVTRRTDNVWRVLNFLSWVLLLGWGTVYTLLVCGKIRQRLCA